MKKSIKTLATMLALLLLTSLFTLTSYAAETTVTTLTGAAIQEAVDNAGAGDTIRLVEGTYVLDAMINVNKPVNIVGAGMNKTVIDGSGLTEDSVAILIQEISGPATMNVSGFTVQNAGKNADVADGVIYVSRKMSQNAIVNFDDIELNKLSRAGFKIIGGTVNINNCVVDCTTIWHTVCNGIEVDGEYARDSFGEYPTTVNITNTRIIGAQSTDPGWSSSGVGMFTNTVVNITGCTISDCEYAVASETYWGGSYPEPVLDIEEIKSQNNFSNNGMNLRLTTNIVPENMWLITNDVTGLGTGDEVLYPNEYTTLYAEFVPAERTVENIDALLASGFDPATDFAFLYSEGSDSSNGEATILVASDTGYTALLAAVPDVNEVSRLNTETGDVAPFVSSDETEVIANSNPSYIIVIPELVDFGTVTRAMPLQTKDFFVRIEDALLEYNAVVTVDVTSDFTMKNAVDATKILAYKLYNVTTDGTELAAGGRYCSFSNEAGDGITLIGNDYLEQVDGRVTTDPGTLTRAGAYSDTMVFVCEYVAA